MGFFLVSVLFSVWECLKEIASHFARTLFPLLVFLVALLLNLLRQRVWRASAAHVAIAIAAPADIPRATTGRQCKAHAH